jgi:hypothetical protein
MTIRDQLWNIPLLGIVIGLIGAIPVGYTLFGSAGLDAISVVATTLLTFGLVILYKQQHLVLRHQQEPLLDINDITIEGNLEHINLDVSNFGGGPATSMDLKIGLYELNGTGPVQTAQGRLRRVESLGESEEVRTRASSIRPTEVNIGFEAVSRGVIASGGQAQNQDSLASLVMKELKKNRDVIYGKITISYTTKFAEEVDYVSDFSLKFTRRDELQYEPMEFLPWKDENQRRELGG